MGTLKWAKSVVAPQVIMLLTTSSSFNFKALWIKIAWNVIFKNQELQQEPSAALVRQMGWQLLASHCVMRLGGAVQLQGSSRWLAHSSRLPSLRRPDILVEAVDASGGHLMRDGFRNYLGKEDAVDRTQHANSIQIWGFLLYFQCGKFVNFTACLAMLILYKEK